MKNSEIKLRNLQESDCEIYKIMFSDRANFNGIKYDFIFENTWEKMMGETMQVWTIINPITEQIYGFCQLDNYNSSTPEIGVDILDEYKNMGFGQACIEMMIDHCKQNKSFDYIRWSALKDNVASIHLAEKFGGEVYEPEESSLEEILKGLDLDKNKMIEWLNKMSDRDFTRFKEAGKSKESSIVTYRIKL